IGKHSSLDNRFTGTARANLDGVAVVDQRCDIGSNPFHWLAQFDCRERRTELFGARQFHKIVKLVEMNEVVSARTDETVIDLGNGNPRVADQFLLIPYTATKADKAIVIRRRHIKQHYTGRQRAFSAFIEGLSEERARTDAMVAALLVDH